MSASTCAVTGANGFVGKNLVRRFHALGWRVIALLRHPGQVAADIEARRFVLGDPVAPDMLAGVDVLVHTAYDFSMRKWADILRVNVVGSEYLFDAAARAGVKRQIFISSMAAFEGCRSDYGRGKLAAEDFATIRGGVAIRPGMIYSKESGGIAAQIMTVACKYPVIPMIGRGDYPLYTCHIDDLCDLIIHTARAGELPGGILLAANASPVTLLGLVEAASDSRSRVILSVPWRWVTAGLWMLERIGLRLAFRSDSVVSLVHSNPAVDFNALKLPVQFRPFLPLSDYGVFG